MSFIEANLDQEGTYFLQEMPAYCIAIIATCVSHGELTDNRQLTPLYPTFQEFTIQEVHFRHRLAQASLGCQVQDRHADLACKEMWPSS